MLLILLFLVCTTAGRNTIFHTLPVQLPPLGCFNFQLIAGLRGSFAKCRPHALCRGPRTETVLCR